jgi:uncharacterized protein YgiM (DUF1202 family)
MPKIRLLAVFLLLFASVGAFAAEMSVTVKQTQVRDKASFLGKVLGVLNYADRVTVIDSSSKAWIKVTGPDGRLTGWVSASALTTKKVELAAGSESAQQSASSGEVALAGKGFNETVEQEYKSDGKLDYTWVDKMEKITVSPNQLSAFVSQGALTPQEGGSQ